MPVESILEELVRGGRRLPDGVRDRILALGPAAVPELIAILDDEALLSETAPGAGWAPIHAVDLLGELRAGDAVEPMLRVLAGTEFLDIVHDRILQRMPQIGAPVIEPALHAYADSRDDDFRLSLAAVLSRTGVRDEQIFTLLLERLDREPSEAHHLVDYGDRRALPRLHDALDRCVVTDGRIPFANQDLIELRAAIEGLGGVLNAEQRATVRQVDEQSEVVRAALFGKLQREPTAAGPPKRGRNQPCWCGSGRKYKVCHLRADEDALLAG
jgi:hypothetical protein